MGKAHLEDLSALLVFRIESNNNGAYQRRDGSPKYRQVFNGFHISQMQKIYFYDDCLEK